MKKISLFLTILILFAALAPISAIAANEYCTVVFRTTDEFIRIDCNRMSIRYDVKIGDKIHTPYIISSLYGYEYAYRYVSTGETVDPTAMIATGKMMYFDVYYPDRPEVIHKITYICHDYPGIEVPGNIYDHDEITMGCADGFVIKENDVPFKAMIPGSNTSNLHLVWTPDPVGYEVHEDVTFTATVEDDGIYAVIFWDRGHNALAFCSAPRGGSVEPPTEVPDWGNYMFTGKWSNDDYLNVQDHVDVFAQYVLRGDANGNDTTDVGDATLILRSIVGLDESKFNYDFNKDGRINSGDAAAILREIVGR